ncbi:MAG: Uma2 family endonuclease [Pyrinomonadaceae bacterium]
MPEVLEQTKPRNSPSRPADNYTSTIYEGVYYPEEREDDMGETSIHAKLINRLLAMILNFFDGREDIFATTNMNLYFEPGNPRRWFAPDLLVAFGVPNVERSSYLLWREKIFPQVIVEIASEKTWSNDIDEKLRTYEEKGAEEYYILDSEFAYLPSPLMAFRRQGANLVELNTSNNRIFSPRLGLEIVMTENTFRLFNPQTNEFLLSLEESEKKRNQAESELERLKAEIKKLKKQK